MGRSDAFGKRAWELYLESDVVDQRIVRPEVAESWKRCRELKVDPIHAADLVADPARLLAERLGQKDQLIRTAEPFLKDLSYLVSGSQFQVVLADEGGLLLETLGDRKILSRTKEVDLCPGANWSEESKGTNAIGTALANRGPVQINAWEHFCECNQFLTCYAAPIRDPAGNLVGVLDASGEHKAANPHTLAMVVATARAIECQLQMELTTRKLHIVSRYSEALTQRMSDGLIAIDRDGIITHVNARGGELLGVAPSKAQGNPLRQICSDRGSLLRALDTGEEQEEELFVEPSGKRVRAAISALRDERGLVVGALALLHEISVARSPDRRCAALRPHRYSFDHIIGEGPAIRAAKEYARQAAESSSTVLVLGESGSGKELFVNAIHDASSRSGQPLVAINCASLPESLIESELFGYAEGSFTGARKGGQAGKFELANGGTLFLDEIGDMPLSTQAKLLRVLQERTVCRIGSAHELALDIRLIAATHRDLRAETERGAFRMDLYYRLAVLEIVVPPLRKRVEDIPVLAERIAAKIAAKLNRRPVRIEEDFASRLCAYSWPGNVRELENVIERAIHRSGDRGLLTADLLDVPHDEPLRAPARKTPCMDTMPAKARSLQDVEKEAIATALSQCGGNIFKAAGVLGIGRNTLYRKIERYKLAPLAPARSAAGPPTPESPSPDGRPCSETDHDG